MDRLQIDIAYACYHPERDPGIVLIDRGPARIVGLFDAWGSWGHGIEAAGITRTALSERWGATPPLSMEAAIADVLEVVSSTPAQLRGDFGCDFAGILVAVHDRTVEVAACGGFSVALVNAAESMLIFKPRMLINQLEKPLSPDELKEFPARNVCVGPYLAPSAPDPFQRSGSLIIAQDSVLVVAYRDLMTMLLDGEPASWLSLPAGMIRDSAHEPRLSRCPLIVVRYC